MIDRQVVQSKLVEIEQYLIELEPLLKLPTPRIVNDYTKLRIVERDFQLIVDTMVSINSHIIVALELTPPEDYQSTFLTLAQNNFLPADFAIKLAPVVGLRNMIVHQYGDVNRKQFIDDLKNGSREFHQYSRLIKQLINKKSVL